MFWRLPPKFLKARRNESTTHTISINGKSCGSKRRQNHEAVAELEKKCWAAKLKDSICFISFYFENQINYSLPVASKLQFVNNN
jgi:hypothetical protein